MYVPTYSSRLNIFLYTHVHVRMYGKNAKDLRMPITHPLAKLQCSFDGNLIDPGEDLDGYGTSSVFNGGAALNIASGTVCVSFQLNI